MKHAITFALAGIAATTHLTSAHAAPPINRADCTLGYSSLQMNARASVEPIDVLDIQLSADGGDGVAVECAARLLGGVYVYGDYREHAGSFNVGLTFDDETQTGTFGLDVKRARIGIGYEHWLSNKTAAYGQIGYASADYDYDRVFVVLDSGGAQFGPGDLDRTSDAGLDLEGGLVWKPSDLLNLAGYVRYTENHKLAFDDQSGLSFSQKDADAWGAGVQVRYALAGPVFLNADLLAGDIEEASIGIGLSF